MLWRWRGAVQPPDGGPAAGSICSRQLRRPEATQSISLRCSSSVFISQYAPPAMQQHGDDGDEVGARAPVVVVAFVARIAHAIRLAAPPASNAARTFATIALASSPAAEYCRSGLSCS